MVLTGQFLHRIRPVHRPTQRYKLRDYDVSCIRESLFVRRRKSIAKLLEQLFLPFTFPDRDGCGIADSTFRMTVIHTMVLSS